MHILIRDEGRGGREVSPFRIQVNARKEEGREGREKRGLSEQERHLRDGRAGREVN